MLVFVCPGLALASELLRLCLQFSKRLQAATLRVGVCQLCSLLSLSAPMQASMVVFLPAAILF